MGKIFTLGPNRKSAEQIGFRIILQREGLLSALTAKRQGRLKTATALRPYDPHERHGGRGIGEVRLRHTRTRRHVPPRSTPPDAA